MAVKALTNGLPHSVASAYERDSSLSLPACLPPRPQEMEPEASSLPRLSRLFLSCPFKNKVDLLT
jgi:hypothetical protein